MSSTDFNGGENAEEDDGSPERAPHPRLHRPLRRKFMKLIALFATLLAVPTIMLGTALNGGFDLNAGSGQQVAVGPCSANPAADCIDFDFSGAKSTPATGSGLPPVATSGTVDGTGNTAIFTLASSFMGDLAGSNVIVSDLSSSGEPTGVNVADFNFITFTGEPWTIELTQIQAGSFGLSGCGGTGSSGQVCSPPGTPFNESNTSCTMSMAGNALCSVGVNFNFVGIANDGSGNLSNVQGTFGTTFSATSLQQVNLAIGGGSDVVTSDSATLSFSPIVTTTTPEPVTSALVGAGLIGIGLLRRKCRQTR
jgi:hypothetical protein